MSTTNYKKVIMDSLKEGAIATGVIFEYMILEHFFKVSPPTAKLDISNAAKKVSLHIWRGPW